MLGGGVFGAVGRAFGIGERVSKRLEDPLRLGDADVSGLLETAREPDLVIVDVLALGVPPRNDDGFVPTFKLSMIVPGPP